MTDINDLVQEFLRSSSDGDAGASLFEMRLLYDILEGYLNWKWVGISSIFATAVYLANYYSSQSDFDETESSIAWWVSKDAWSVII